MPSLGMALLASCPVVVEALTFLKFGGGGDPPSMATMFIPSRFCDIDDTEEVEATLALADLLGDRGGGAITLILPPCFGELAERRAMRSKRVNLEVSSSSAVSASDAVVVMGGGRGGEE